MRKGLKSLVAVKNLAYDPAKINRYCLSDGLSPNTTKKVKDILVFKKERKKIPFWGDNGERFRPRVTWPISYSETSSKLRPQTLLDRNWQTRSGY